jgi:hypothetical protein
MRPACTNDRARPDRGMPETVFGEAIAIKIYRRSVNWGQKPSRSCLQVVDL